MRGPLNIRRGRRRCERARVPWGVRCRWEGGGEVCLRLPSSPSCFSLPETWRIGRRLEYKRSAHAPLLSSHLQLSLYTTPSQQPVIRTSCLTRSALSTSSLAQRLHKLSPSTRKPPVQRQRRLLFFFFFLLLLLLPLRSSEMAPPTIRGTADVDRIEAPVTFKAYLMCAFASFGGIYFGYDVGWIR